MTAKERHISATERIEILSALQQSLLAGGTYWDDAFQRAEAANAWFTQQNIRAAVRAICDQLLDRQQLERWLAAYELPEQSKNTGIVMAGNIPLVGFADWLAVFICGHTATVKLSDKDTVLFTAIMQFLVNKFGTDKINTTIVDKLAGYDAVIATGSDNSAVYFEQYFAHVPHLIRRNRTGVALIHGDESDDQLVLLWQDISAYFGLGCRNVTFLCLPQGYDPAALTAIWEKADLIQHHKYRNNYEYDLAVSMLNKELFYYNENILLINKPDIHARIGSVNYQLFDSMQHSLAFLNTRADKIQCVVSVCYTHLTLPTKRIV